MQQPGDGSATRSPLSPRRPLVWIWALLWLAGAGWILARIGIWDRTLLSVDYGDIKLYGEWAKHIVEVGSLPDESKWQYPSGAAFLFLMPRLFVDGYGGDYGAVFLAMLLLCSLIVLVALIVLGTRRREFAGVWVWLLAMPALGGLPGLRFDLVPTAFAVVALVMIHRRPGCFGAIVGIGAMLKVWPVLCIFGEWDRRRLWKSIAWLLTAVGAILLASALAFGDPFTFLGQQGGRGLQVEAIAAAPWQLRDVVTGTPVPQEVRYGAYEIPSSTADTVAMLLNYAALVVFAVAAAWWLLRDRAIRTGRDDLADETVARDFVFALVLLFVATSRVLSPQYMVWLLGLAAVVLCASDSRLRRPAWIVVAAVIFSATVYDNPGNTLLRNLALLGATVDACVTLAALLRRAPRSSSDLLSAPRPAAADHPAEPSSSPV